MTGTKQAEPKLHKKPYRPNSIQRLTVTTRLVIEYLLYAANNLDSDEVYGYQIYQEVGMRLPTIYKILEKLRNAGMASLRIETAEEIRNDGVNYRPSRRFYRLTPEGIIRARAILFAPENANADNETL